MKKITAYIQILRPSHYLKNGFVWLPLFFGYKLQDPTAVLQTACAFLAFCLVASCVYILNDMADAAEDRQHPVKKKRPLASGVMSRLEAAILFVILLVLSGALSAAFFQKEFLFVMGGYIILNVAYSIFLKHLAIIDVVCIAIGFVLRIFAGGIAANVLVSPWIIIMTFLLALFLALAKRRDDLLLADRGHTVRKSLAGYNLEFVSMAMGVMASVIIVAYILYTVSAEVVERHGSHKLYITGLWVIVGLLRYMQATFVEKRTGGPTQVLLKDTFLQVVIVLWLATFYILLYGSGT